MDWDGLERRRHGMPTIVERRGMVRSALGGLRAPDVGPLAFTEITHPARLTPTDLENPHGFRERLVAWLMKQH